MCGRATCFAPSPTNARARRLRFVTDSDYPPFHYFDEEGVLTGFNVDLARAICEALAVECEIRPVDWEDLFKNLDDGEADAAIASIRIDADALTKADFSSRYYATPGRFIARKDNELKDVRPETVDGKKIGVVKGTGHEAFLKQYFPAAEAVVFETSEEAQSALKAGDLDFVFGDGVGLTFWLNGVTSDACCEFRGGSYLRCEIFRRGRGHRREEGQPPARRGPELRARAGARLWPLRRAVPALLPHELLLVVSPLLPPERQQQAPAEPRRRLGLIGGKPDGHALLPGLRLGEIGPEQPVP